MTGEKLMFRCERRAFYGMRSATGSLVWFTKNVWVEYRILGVIGVIVPRELPVPQRLQSRVGGADGGNCIVAQGVSRFRSRWLLRRGSQRSSRPWRARGSCAIVQSGGTGDLGRLTSRRFDGVEFPGHRRDAVTGQRRVGVESTNHWLISTQVRQGGAAGAVSGGIDKCIFVGSPGEKKLLGDQAAPTHCCGICRGKDPFVVCDDCSADLDRIHIALRVFQSMGQLLVPAVLRGVFCL